MEQLTSLGRAPSCDHGSEAWKRAASDPAAVASRAHIEAEWKVVALAEALATANTESGGTSSSLISRSKVILSSSLPILLDRRAQLLQPVREPAGEQSGGMLALG